MVNLIRHLFLPHHTNNFRAKLLHFDSFVIYAVFFLILSLTLRLVHYIDPNVLGYATDIRVDRLLDLTNQKRSQSGLGGLSLNDQLSQAAAGKAQDMFANGYWAHNSPSGKTPWDFINGAGYVYTIAGENLAKNFSNSDGVVEAWMNSPSHRENIMRGDYQDVGFAVVNGTLNGEETTLVVQIFGKPLAKQVAQKPVETTAVAAISPPVKSAQAEETKPSLTQVSDLTIASKAAEASSVAALVSPEPSAKPTPFMAFANTVIKNPLIDITHVTKQLLLGISGLLLFVLVIDGVYIWRRKIVRIGGRNLAHIAFMFILTGLVWSLSLGTIL